MLANLRPVGIEVEPYPQRELIPRHCPVAVAAASWQIPSLLEADLAIGQQIQYCSRVIHRRVNEAHGYCYAIHQVHRLLAGCRKGGRR